MDSKLKGTNNATLLHIGLLIPVTLAAYFKVFHAGFLTWDDGEYILHNADIQGFSLHNIKAWFSHYYIGNYHPVTMASYAFDYTTGNFNPFVYHLTSILLHICNTCLVYMLLNRLQPNGYIALMVASLFALHPAQAESVSWVAERKTVLSGTFSLLSMVLYISYTKTRRATQFLFIFLTSILALLSKGTAVALPLSFIAIDIWLKRPLNSRSVWIEKIPFLILSLITGIVALNAQKSGMFMNVHPAHSWGTTCLYAGYAYIQYIIHFFIPVRISAMYPYPVTTSIIHWLYAAIALCVLVFAYISYIRKWYLLCGGIVFYTAHIIFVLQLVPFGEALMADRYLYLACIGFTYPAVSLIYTKFSEGWVKWAVTAAAVLSIPAMVLFTYTRNTDWQSDKNFYMVLLDDFPNSAVTHYSAGAMYLKTGDYEKAEEHLIKAARLDPANYKAWYNLGQLYIHQRKAMEALEAFNNSIAINGYGKAYFSRALLHHSMGNNRMALADIEQVLSNHPANALAWCLKGECVEQNGDLANAIYCYSKSITLDAHPPSSFIRRGLAFSKNRQYQPALNDLSTAARLDPKNGEPLFFLAIVKQKAGLDPCPDLLRAIGLGYTRAGAAIKALCNGK